MKMFWKAPLAALSLIAAAPHPCQGASSPKVVVTIAPVHALVAGVMDGIGAPVLLVPGGASPHSYSIKPSQARALSEAGIVVRVGGPLENFLDRALVNLAAKAVIVTLAEARGMILYAPREGGVWQKRKEQSGGTGKPGDHEPRARGGFDPHIWLDPENAKRIVGAVSLNLQKIYPDHAGAFERNAEKIVVRLDNLDRELRRATEPVRSRPFVVFHDAYRYFEERYGLNAAGAITVSPDRPAGARRIAEIRERIKSQGVVCVFTEPQFRPKLVETLIEGTGAKAGELDPSGAGLAPGRGLYFNLMRNLAASLSACLNRPL